MVKDLTIYATHACNMRCSFCSYISNLTTELNAISVDEKLEKLESVLQTQDIDVFGFTGGEPTLVPEYLMRAILLIRKYKPTSIININTNGTGLTTNLVSFLNFHNVALRLAFSGVDTGEKSITNAIKISKNPQLVSLLKQVKYKCLLVIAFKSKPFAEDIIGLFKLLPFTSLQINPDQTATFSMTDILYLEKELVTLNTIMPNIHRSTSFLATTRHCPVASCFNFDIFGNFEPFKCQKIAPWDGCPDLMANMGSVENMEYYVTLTERNKKGLV